MSKLNQRHYEIFSVLDDNNLFVTGLTSASFTIQVYDPSNTEVSGTTSLQFQEVGVGNYKVSFIPNTLGEWFIMVKHNTYFPWGKSNEISVQENDFNDITTVLTDITTVQSTVGSMSGDVSTILNIETGKWRISGNQMIFYGPDNFTELMRFMLYDKNGDPTETNVFERRKVV